LLTVPEVAVIVTDPVAIEVTSPADETVATAASEDDHVAVASDITEPPASLTVAVKLAVSAIDDKASELGATSRVAPTCETVTAAIALAAPDAAVIVAVPLLIAVTKPDDEMVATDASEEDHVTGAPVTITPPMVTVAESCCVSERDEKARFEGDNAISA
jgi:hypothetical protein